ncbi:Protein of unknown function [Paramicrobacterium humi]|uniref:DUF4012 domain-containing protein n=1 Tax=Paramicrobacterium humi TaxID=640635 RepID=A0A1H4NGD1_9MICO|nr:DUF4012 domain-containing protein [Microbacterium humi]SEB93928.1 Protein of unknown function [Microbacterium humi]
MASEDGEKSAARRDAALPSAPKKPFYKRVWPWATLGTIIIVVVAAITVAVAAKSLLDQASAVKGTLETAMPLVHQVKDEILDGDLDKARATAKKLADATEEAKSESDGNLWRLGESVPSVGANLTAVRLAAEVADELADDVIIPMTSVSLDDLQPSDGRFDLKAIAGLGATIDDALDATKDAKKTIAGIDRKPLMSQVSSALDSLEPQLDSASEMLEGASTVVKVLPNALGADGPRNYLMLFQNNAESRGTGGNPASILLLNVTDGKIEIADQASSTDFKNGRADHDTSIDDRTIKLYGDKIIRYMQDMTLTPNFPTTAHIAQAWWAERSDVHIDGVLSFDPVALSYLLKATGPVKLATGDTLTSENAVPLLLNEVYYRYPGNTEQDAYFAAAAASIFDAVTSGADDIKALADSLVKATDEGRLMYWTANEDEAKLIQGSRITGTLPQDNSGRDVTGVYINDTTGSKMDYYMNVAVDLNRACAPESDSSVSTVTLSNVLDPAKANSLPAYIQGPFYKHGRIATDVVIYAPIGSSIGGLTLNGKSVKPTYSGADLGRSVVKISVTTDPGKKTTIGYELTGDGSASNVPIEVWHTPMVRETPIKIAEKGCGS